MKQLYNGVKLFQQNRYPQLQDRFQELGSGQKPPTLFITCSDSRIDPSLITHSQPGELFVIRNAGNLVPIYSQTPSGETATIEYAVSVLKVEDVVVCGHSDCGAMKALAAGPEKLGDLPEVQRWLSLARPSPGSSVAETIEHNVLVQLEHLMTHPAVARAVRERGLRLHGWVYDIPTGEVRCSREGTFEPLMAMA